MIKLIRNVLTWRSGKVRLAAVRCLVGVGLAVGFFGAVAQKAVAGEPNVEYCIYYGFGNPTSGCTQLYNCPSAHGEWVYSPLAPQIGTCLYYRTTPPPSTCKAFYPCPIDTSAVYDK